MRALICQRHGPVEDVLPGDMPNAPAPGPHDVTIAVEVASVSHATKLLIKAGRPCHSCLAPKRPAASLLAERKSLA
jgi:NADPH:quinone reductase-like Zn-dependent oxidoreductase